MNLFNIIKAKLIKQLKTKEFEQYNFAENLLDRITLEPPKDAKHGCMATNAAMVLAKPAGIPPRQLAEQICLTINNLEEVESTQIAGPGFINLSLNRQAWLDSLSNLQENPKTFGSCNIGKGKKVNVEYVSANPTGPLHVGHARGAVFGDALANLLKKVGYEVTKEFYVNDAGGQIKILLDSAILRYQEACGQNIGKIPEGLYPGEYLVTIANNIKAKYGDDLLKQANGEEKIQNFALNAILEEIKHDLALAGINHDIFASEKTILDNDKPDKAINLLKQKELIFTGVLEAPKGKLLDDWEEKEQLLFKSTNYGDDQDRALKKSDNSNTYFANDLGYHLDKIERGFDILINILGADHGGYVKRISAGVAALSDEKTQIIVKLCQLVKLSENGVALKMSKRAGNFVTMQDLIQKIGKDVLRFIMLTRKNDAGLEIDIAKAIEQSKDNPVFYVQYAHARARSVLRSYNQELIKLQDIKYNYNDEEFALVKLLAEYPRQIELAAKSYEPHRLAYYLQELATSFHSLWNSGNTDPSKKFTVEDKNITAARLLLVNLFTLVLGDTLLTLGVEPVEEMR